MLLSVLALTLAGSSAFDGASGTAHAVKLLPQVSHLSVLHGFGDTNNDGAYPGAGLIADRSGALYGTTGGGGPQGLGTAFKLTRSRSGYIESVIHFFQGNDGAHPGAVLLADPTGVLYGTTYDGGTSGYGNVFALWPTGPGYMMSVLYNFQSGTDGAYPTAGLISDPTGALYGTTLDGGGSASCYQGCGTVFKLTPSGIGYTETVLYRFQGGSDGASPAAGLTADTTGALYGTSVAGGGSECSVGCGTVFKLTPFGSGYVETVLHSFRNENDGALPEAGLIVDAGGALYGTTTIGGGHSGYGSVFKLTRSGIGYAESILYRFQGRNDGAHPWAGLLADATGALYGTTAFGGHMHKGCSEIGGCGTVFKLVPSGTGYTHSVLHRFRVSRDGELPYGGLIADATGALYGTTGQGGPQGAAGTAFKLSP